MDFSSQNPATTSCLSLAARGNDEATVAKLLPKYNPNCVDNRGWTCLHEAAYNDSYESLITILNYSQTRGRAETHEGHTALYLACKNNCSLKTIRALLDSVKNIANYGSTESVTPLHIACSQGNVEMIEILLEYGAIMDVLDFDGDTPLHETALHAQYSAMLTLLYAGADPEITNRSGFTAFHLACAKGYFPNVELLFPFVNDINQQTASGDTALHFAVHGANEHMIDFLLDHGADPNIKNKNGELPIEISLNANAAVFQKLLSVTDRDKIDRNIVINACKPHNLQCDILDAVLNSDLGPDFFNIVKPFDPHIIESCLSPTTYLTHAPLNHYLYICGYIYQKSPEKFREFFYLFLMQGVDVNPINVTECPPLVYALYVHNTQHQLSTACFKEVFQILIDAGCDVDICSEGKLLWNDFRLSDPFIMAMDNYPLAAVIMMPYSLYNDPEKYLQFVIKNRRLDEMPIDVQNQLMIMIDKNYSNISPESLDYHARSLKHLCRYKVRSYLRNMTRRNRQPVEITTTQFLRILECLPVPPIIRKYLRYIEN